MYKNSDNHVLVLSFLKRKISFFEKKKLKFVRSQNKGNKKNTCSCSYDVFLTTSVYFIESIKPGDLHG